MTAGKRRYKRLDTLIVAHPVPSVKPKGSAVALINQVDTDLFEPAEYLDVKRPGYFSLCAVVAGDFKQKGYPLEHLAPVVEGVNPHLDTWISQGTFHKRNRRLMNLDTVGLLFVDCDTYHVPALARQTPEELTAGLLRHCRDEGIPEPSLVIFSGRGLQAKWLLSSALEAVRVPEWNRAQRALASRLIPYGADFKALDASRILRLDRTVNTKSGETVRVVHVTGGVEGCPARYDFAELERLVVLPENRAEVPVDASSRARVVDRRPALAGSHPAFLMQRLNWTRLSDLRYLWKLRGGTPEGWREYSLFWELNFLLLAEPGRHCDLWNESQVLRAEIDAADGWVQPSKLSTLYAKAKEMTAGKVVEFNGREYPTLYTPRNQTLIDVFNITPDEERHLRTIISRDERNRRRRERDNALRRAAGILTRDEYEAGALERVKPWEDLSISRRTFYRQGMHREWGSRLVPEPPPVESQE